MKSPSMIRRTLAMLPLSVCFLTSATLNSATVTITPQEDTSLIQIAGCGFHTFHKFASNDPSLSSVGIPSGTAYFRWTWLDYEPQDSQFNWALIDNTLSSARACGQTFLFRIMGDAAPATDIPQWLINLGAPVRQTSCEGNHGMLDLDNATVQHYLFRLIREMGKRYDDNPDLAGLDIGVYGLWGEWHVYCDTALMPTVATRLKIIDSIYYYFPNTPLLSGVDDKPRGVYAASKGRSSWRADCWGGGAWFDYSSYPLMNSMIPNAWKTGPVGLESCGTMSGWSVPITAAVDSAINWHANFAHNKSATIPTADVPEVKRLVKAMGFRLVLRSVTYNNTMAAGSNASIVMDWDNLGIAPPYRDLRIAFRLTNSQNQNSAAVITSQSVKGWLPGTKSGVTVSYPVPAGTAQGQYTLQTALVYHNAIDRVTAMANKTRTSDLWLPIGPVTIGQVGVIDRGLSMAALAKTARSPNRLVAVMVDNGARPAILLAMYPGDNSRMRFFTLQGKQIVPDPRVLK